MGEVIVITSGKGGVGKTTTTANIGIGLSSAGKKVLVIDTDLGLRNLDVVLGLENRIVYNLVDVIESKCRLKQAVIKDTRFENLYLLPSAQTKDKTSVSPEQMKKLIDELKDDYDFILLDCPAFVTVNFPFCSFFFRKSLISFCVYSGSRTNSVIFSSCDFSGVTACGVNFSF